MNPVRACTCPWLWFMVEKGCSYPHVQANRGCNGSELNYFIHFLWLWLAGQQNFWHISAGLCRTLFNWARCCNLRHIVSFGSPVHIYGALCWWRFIWQWGCRARTIYDLLNCSYSQIQVVCVCVLKGWMYKWDISQSRGHTRAASLWSVCWAWARQHLGKLSSVFISPNWGSRRALLNR